MRGLLPAVKILCVVGAVVIMGGCVSREKYDEIMGLNRQMSDTIQQLTNERDKALAENARLKSELAKMNADLAMGNVDAKRWKDKHDAAQAALDDALARLKEQPGIDYEALKKWAKEHGFDLTPEGAVILPSDIFFDSGKVTLKPGVADQLKGLANVLAEEYPGTELAIEGHTDSDPIKVSGWADNWQLASERARAILKVLEKEGVPAGKMHIVGYSMYKPQADNSTKEGKAKNRRVELRIVSPPVAME